MKSIILITLSIFVSCFVSSCNDNTAVSVKQSPINRADTLNIGCLSSFEINPFGTNDTINRIYGDKRIKEGYWIIFGFIPTKKEHATSVSKLVRMKLADGYYKKDKKEGFWKFYKEDGSLKDSVEYRNDMEVRL